MTKYQHTLSFSMKPAFLSLVVCNAITPISTAVQADEIEKVVVTNSRYATKLNDVSRSLNIYGTELIEQTQVDHIQQVLNQQSGVFVNRNSGQEMLLAIRSPVLTGAGACGSYLTMENGVPLRPNGFCNVNELFESHYELAERIELVKGPSSVFYGSGGLHGAVNILNSANGYRAPFVKATIGQWGYQQVSFLTNNESTALSATLSHDGGYRNDSGFDQQKLSFSNQTVVQGVDIDTFITATNLNQDTAGYVVGLDSYKDEAQSKTNPNPEAYRDANAVRISQRYDFNNGFLLTPFVRYSDMEFLQHFVPGKPVERNHHYSFGTQSQYQTMYTDKLRFDVGLDTEFAKISLSEEQYEPTEGSEFLQATIPEGKHYDYTVDALTIAGFLGANYQLTDQFSLDGGLRLENIRYDYTNEMNSGRVDENGNECGFGGCRFNRPESRDDDFTIVSPKLGLVYQGGNQSGFINLSHGFRAPQTTELYRLQREQSVSDLDPEELLGVDASWSIFQDSVELTFAAYWYEKSDVIIRDSDFFYVSDGETLHKGIEFKFAKKLTESISIDGNVSYSKHTYENNPNLSSDDIVGNEISNAPNLLANIATKYEQANWSVGLNAQFVDEHYLNPENTSVYDGHTLFHLRSQIQLASNVNVFLNVDNLFDKRYAERANYSGFTGERYFPGLPRNVKLSVKYEF